MAFDEDEGGQFRRHEAYPLSFMNRAHTVYTLLLFEVRTHIRTRKEFLDVHELSPTM
jgi:hypothetical protein